MEESSECTLARPGAPTHLKKCRNTDSCMHAPRHTIPAMEGFAEPRLEGKQNFEHTSSSHNNKNTWDVHEYMSCATVLTRDTFCDTYRRGQGKKRHTQKRVQSSSRSPELRSLHRSARLSRHEGTTYSLPLSLPYRRGKNGKSKQTNKKRTSSVRSRLPFPEAFLRGQRPANRSCCTKPRQERRPNSPKGSVQKGGREGGLFEAQAMAILLQ